MPEQTRDRSPRQEREAAEERQARADEASNASRTGSQERTAGASQSHEQDRTEDASAERREQALLERTEQWDEARRQDAADLAERWPEMNERDEAQLKDAYRAAAEQADAARRELEAAEADLPEVVEEAGRLMEARHDLERRENERSGSSAQDLTARQDREVQWLETERVAVQQRLDAARADVESQLDGARRDVVAQRDAAAEARPVDLGDLQERKAALASAQEAARDERANLALTTRALATAAMGEAEKKERDVPAKRAFEQSVVDTIARENKEGREHPLHFLVDPATSELRRQRANEDHAAVEVGHETSFHSRAPERFMLEDSDFNDWSNRYAETKKLAIFKEAVDIEGVAVERRTALMWERMKLLELEDGRRVRDLPAAPGWSADRDKDKRR